jgi:hypothetical protein
VVGTEFLRGQGLGNQLFCYVTARCLALDLGYEFGSAGKDRFAFNIHNDRGMYFMDIDLGSTIDTVAPHSVYREREERLFLPNSLHDIKTGCYVADYDEDMLGIADNTIVYGNMQSEGYFIKHRDEIREWLRVKKEYDDFSLSADDLCVMNMRGGEYRNLPELMLRKGYWLNAMANIRDINPTMRFAIVTDDLALAKEQFPDLPAYHGDIARDYVAIKNARYLILSNSSFAFFPAFTSDTLRYLIAPKYWARHNVSEGYWASGQNIYSEWMYQDRAGRLFGAAECRKEWDEYRSTPRFRRRLNRPMRAGALFALSLRARNKLYRIMTARKAARHA